MSFGKFISNGKEVIIGGRNFTTDKSLNMTDENILGVSMPFKTMTQEEFDSASEEDKKGIILTNPQVGIHIARPEIYSEEETLIGSWLGKPLYRKTIDIKTPSTVDQYKDVCSLGFDIDVVNIYGFLRTQDDLNTQHSVVPLSHYQNSTNYMYFYVHKNTSKESFVSIYTKGSGYTNKSAWIIVEYTKTTDE